MFFYAPDRKGKNAETFLRGFDGILQLDGYQGYDRLTRSTRPVARQPICLCATTTLAGFEADGVGVV